MKKVLTVFGTRPEAIKMAPLIIELQKQSSLETIVGLSGQHDQMLTSVMNFFQINAKYDLKVMERRPSLTQIYSRVLSGMEPILVDEKPDLVLVHGDTATTAAASMAAFLQGIPVGHVEAGLRTGNLQAPWPEEFNRRLAGMLTSLHFAPTETSAENLKSEGVPEGKILVSGNTVIDALLVTLEKLTADEAYKARFYRSFPFVGKASSGTLRRLILVTGHRRENLGNGLKSVCQALLELSKEDDLDIVFPVHPNPRVTEPVHQVLDGVPNVYLTDPLSYMDFVFMMKQCDFIITDSGGVQEEAPTLGKPVLVTRTVTERPEAVDAGMVKLVGADRASILKASRELLLSPADRQAGAPLPRNLYGDGQASHSIVQRILSEL